MRPDINGQTRLLAVMGYPIEHSLSPAMHEKTLDHLEMNYRYLPFLVAPQHLSAAVLGFRALGGVGFNATIPHKESLLPLMDWVSEEASQIGAINTVHVDAASGALKGYNTDGDGFITALAELNGGHEIAGRQVVMIGAGGAARAIVVALAKHKAATIRIANRHPERAAMLIGELQTKMASLPAQALPLDQEALALETCDLLINTTSLGMKGEHIEPLDLHRLPKHALVCDIVYGKNPTPLIQMARSHHLSCQDGLAMLIHQGAKAFTIWTQREMPITIVRHHLRHILGERS